MGRWGVPLGGPSVEVEPLASGSAGSYGLVVSGAGLVAYVDADFGVSAGQGRWLWWLRHSRRRGGRWGRWILRWRRSRRCGRRWNRRWAGYWAM